MLQGEREGYGGGTEWLKGIPPDFVRQIKVAMLHKGLNPMRVNLDKFEQLIARMWSDPYIQDEWKDPVNQGLDGLPLLTAVIREQLFTNPDSAYVKESLGFLKESDAKLTAAELKVLQGDTDTALLGATEQAPNPFGENVGIGQNDYDTPTDPGSISDGYFASTGEHKHKGIDYLTRPGMTISAPTAGTVKVTKGWPYGTLVELTLPDGRRLRFGHLASGIKEGPVNPGEAIGITGIPEAGTSNSDGSVTLVEFLSSGGQYLNPHTFMDPVFAGISLAALGAGAVGTGITHNKLLDKEFPAIYAEFKKYHGRPPSDSDIMRILAAVGNDASVKMIEDYMKGLPSHIPGMNNGQAAGLRSLADGISQTILGHPTTDTVVKTLFDANQVSNSDIANWFNFHGVTGKAGFSANTSLPANPTGGRSGGVGPPVPAQLAGKPHPPESPSSDQDQPTPTRRGPF